MQSVFLPERCCFRVTCNAKDGPVSRLMSLSDYVNFINNAYGEAAGDSFDSFSVVDPTPQEFIRARFDTGIGSGCVAFRLPPGDYPLIFGRDEAKQKHYMIHFPATIWQFKVNQRKVTEVSIYCIFDEPLTDKTMLFYLPLPNCYDSGKICIGSNHWTMEKFSDFHELVGRFFSAPHNADLYDPSKYGANLLTFLKKLQKEGITAATAKPVGTFQDCKNRGLLPAFC